jgi:hypothetical protein
MFFLRLGIVCFGMLVAAPGWYAWNHKIYWVTGFNAKLGRFGAGPTLTLVFMGTLIILFGLFSGGWENISPNEQKHFDREDLKSRRYWKRSRRR